jgi:processing peptidase subunit beta
LAFKGTKKRTQHQIEVEVENIGASLNAYTSREQTVYVARCFKQDAPAMIELLADILQNSTLSSEAIDRERSVILQEKEMVESEWEEVIFDYLHAAAFQGTPLARTILGETENIQSITRDDLVKYISTHYVGPRIVLVAAGGVDHDQIVHAANKHFGSIPIASEFDYEGVGPFPFTGSEIRVKDDTMSLAHIAIAFEGVSWSHPDYFVVMLLQAIVGSWDRSLGAGKNLSARLAERVAHEELVHSYVAFNTCYNQTGLWGVYFVAEPDTLEDAAHAFFHELVRMSKALTEPELLRAKNKVKASILMHLDGTNAVAEDIGRQFLTLGRRLSVPEIFNRIDDVTVNDIKRFLEDHYIDNDPAIAAVGPLRNLPGSSSSSSSPFLQRLPVKLLSSHEHTLTHSLSLSLSSFYLFVRLVDL